MGSGGVSGSGGSSGSGGVSGSGGGGGRVTLQFSRNGVGSELHVSHFRALFSSPSYRNLSEAHHVTELAIQGETANVDNT